MNNRAFVDYSEYNLRRLEDLIALSVGRSRAGACARLLADRYGSYENILAAPSDELRRIAGEELAAFLKLTALAISRSSTDEFVFGIDHSSVEIADYLKKRFLGESVEVILALPLDSAGRVIECREIVRGTVNSSSILTRDLAEAAISVGSKRLMIAHNHPLGIAKVSVEDVSMTAGLSEQLMRAGITLEMHFVIAGMECELVSADAFDQ